MFLFIRPLVMLDWGQTLIICNHLNFLNTSLITLFPNKDTSEVVDVRT